MNDIMGEITIQYPRTVTACHDELRRLRQIVIEAKDLLQTKEKKIEDLEQELDEIEEKGTVSDQDMEGAINAFLDECQRTGPLRFDVPHSDRANRAIVGLHGVVGRNP
jgi:hypothetical protein